MIFKNRSFAAVSVSALFAFYSYSASSSAHAFSSASLYSKAPAPALGLQVKTEDQILKGSIKFIENMSAKAIGFLSDEEISQEKQTYLFKKLLVSSFDMDTIARFSLGRYWRTATKSQRSEYLRLFEEMILKIYSGRFKTYEGQSVDVIEARKNGKKDWIVSSVIVPKNGSMEISVEWRVRYKGGAYKVIDIIVEGVSMGVTQRSDFSSVIQRGGGDLEVLLAHLRAEEK